MKKTHFPTKTDIIEHINTTSGRIGKRDIARAFGIKGDDRTKLKHLLRDLINNGDVTYEHRIFKNPKTLPSVVICEIYELNEDGDFILTPLNDAVKHRSNIKIILPDKEAKNLKPTDKILARIKKTGSENGFFIYHAKLIKQIDKQQKSSNIGIFYFDDQDAVTHNKANLGFIEPVDKKDNNQYRVIEIAKDIKLSDGDLVSYQANKSKARHIKGVSITQHHGSPKSEKALSLISLHAHDIPHIFPPEVILEAENCKAIANSAIAKNNREDLSHLPFVTIDPADAKDHDDALYAENDNAKDNPNGYKIYVAIADVSEYIKPFSQLDKEAFKRGNSVYFPDQVVPMLPERISNNLCSLKENELRPSMVAIIRINENGKKLGQRFTRALIKSHAKLSYQQAQKAFDGQFDDATKHIYQYGLAPILAAYKCLCIARDKRQPLALDLPERKIILGDDGLVKNVVTPERLEAHKLVEECMILANVAAAETLEKRKQPLIYRVHEQPSLAKVEALNDFLKDFDINIAQQDDLKPTIFNDILRKSSKVSNKELINISVLRSQMQAVYQPENIGHFGLNLRKYAHFTSPIRRYADLIVHRALISALNLGDDGLTNDEINRLDEIAEHISTTERRAMKAERETKDRLIAEYLSEKIGATFNARISGVIHVGLFLELSDTGADGFIPLSTINGYYNYDENSKLIYDRKTQSGYRMGDNIEVELKQANASNGALIFKMLTPPSKLKLDVRTSKSPNKSREFRHKSRKIASKKIHSKKIAAKISKPRRRKPKKDIHKNDK